jgi:hypothetical protein
LYYSNAASAFEQQTISGLYRNGKCSLACTKNGAPGTGDDKCTANSISFLEGNRFCKDGIVCQASCLTNQPSQNHQIPLYGKDALNGPYYGLSIEDVGKNSLELYHAHGRNNMDRGMALDNLFLSMAKDAPYKPGFNLPVCMSDQVVLGEVWDDWTRWHHPDAKRMPCV